MTPAAPKHLSRRAKAFWKAIVEEYDLGPHNLELLRRLAEALDRCDAAVAVVAAEGLVVTDKFGQVKAHPAVNVERDCRIAIARLTRELDLDGEPAPDPRMPRRGGR